VINLFSTPIKIVENNSFDNTNLINHCEKLSKKVESGGKHWINKKVFNTSYTYNIYDDKKFYDLNLWISKQVKLFVNELGFENIDDDKTIGWFNIYNKDDYQDWHNHNFYLVSAIYYLKTNTHSAKTYFKNPLPENPNIPKFNPNNPYTWKTYFVEPKENNLVIFKSDLDHCVESHTDDFSRITLAYNFSTLAYNFSLGGSI
jgi:uncharacterized protein (TIGR02466 family)|tara:strand:- start:67 stop:672 length:606 start_codon:yes stop_codon:yes gene_type:complete